MKKFYLKKLGAKAVSNLCKRPAIDMEAVMAIVKPIMLDVAKNGDKALRYYTKKFDKKDLSDFLVSERAIDEACERVPEDLKGAFKRAASNIEKFHKAQMRRAISVETMPGVLCSQEMRAIEKIGVYIPGGKAPLPSTVLMLAIPARLAGCEEIIICTPPAVSDLILFAARLCDIDKIFQVGGAQAIAAMTFGTETIPKADKICGPGNQYVTAAKMLAFMNGTAIDLPAGPTELLVIADKKARPDFVVADLLSQAEHGEDSQVVLVCTDNVRTDKIWDELRRQLKILPRRDIAEKALKNSFILIVSSIEKALDFSNQYAPEHLILNVEKPQRFVPLIQNAGSVFLGPYSCESAGDYASGTNHTLPTYGYAKSYGGVSVDTFVKKITFQKIERRGVKNIGPIVEKMAGAEGLIGHKNAMSLRLNSLS